VEAVAVVEIERTIDLVVLVVLVVLVEVIWGRSCWLGNQALLEDDEPIWKARSRPRK
jgi:hypothetical protein